MNAKEELLEILSENNKTVSNIVCIRVVYEKTFNNCIKVNDLESLDFEYDDGYGGQELFGYVLLDDMDWLERHEYDGSEWWEYKKYPSHLIKEEMK